MSLRTFVFIFIFFLPFSDFAQNIYSDTVQIENHKMTTSDSLVVDTITYNKDTLVLLIEDDSINNEIYKKDSITEILEDSILSNDTVETKPVKSYEEAMNYVNDSLFFEEPDTIYYVIYSLDHLLNKDSTAVSDSTKQAIYNLMEYSRKVNLDKVIYYLQQKIKQDSIIEYKDTTIKIIKDSVFHAVEYLLQSIPKDSVRFVFKNFDRDSILFNSAENETDSVRLNLYDNRGEEAVLWIKKTDVDVFNIYLEDGIYIEKARQQKVVNPTLDLEFEFPELKEVQITEKILPIWDFDGSADIKFNQGFVSESWAEGAESSISTLSVLKYSADYSYGKRRNLDTDFEYRLGYIQAGDNELQKNDDKFEINIKYGKQAFNDWYYSGLLNFRTQFFKGKEYVNDSTVNIVSEFLSPAYLVFSLGLDYKPSNKLTVLISPLTSKFTIVADTLNYDQTRFGVGKNEQVRKEIGAYVKVISKLKFRDNISLENKVNFFTNYTHNPQNVDVDWEMNLGVQLTDFIKMSVNTHFIYDDDVDIPVFKDGVQVGITKNAQFKELFGIGFMYNF